MTHPTGFTSWSNYFSFALAQDFVEKETFSHPQITKNFCEKCGHLISQPFVAPANFLLREIKNPLVISAITISLIAAATLIFYPTQFVAAATTLFPFLVKIKPWMIKLGLFTCVEITITAVGIRALGRLLNKELLHAWQSQKIIPVHIGAKKTSA